MKNKIAVALAAAALLGTAVRADDPNPEVSKIIEKITARRAAKEEARVKQAESWQKGEVREQRRNGFGGGAPAVEAKP